ncbi:MAG: hypothetical protein LUF32_00565 [Clostridiales bacterium]|nr:hypothetical protein [Clostridiales bacterium]
MDQQQYYDRKQYVEQARSSFGEQPERHGAVSFEREDEEAGRRTRGFFRVRLGLAVLLFLVFLLIRQTGWSYQDIDAAAIQEEIGSSVSLPDSFPKLSDIISVTEDEE